jgi:hypothetical protein
MTGAAAPVIRRHWLSVEFHGFTQLLDRIVGIGAGKLLELLIGVSLLVDTELVGRRIPFRRAFLQGALGIVPRPTPPYTCGRR